VGTEWRQECFRFDYVYSGPNNSSTTSTSTTTTSSSSSGGQGYSQLYPQCVAPVVQGLFLGYHGCVLAYGQTGAGKSYTMGSDQERCWQVRRHVDMWRHLLHSRVSAVCLLAGAVQRPVFCSVCMPVCSVQHDCVPTCCMC
jgi:hypothetical protein